MDKVSIFMIRFPFSLRTKKTLCRSPGFLTLSIPDNLEPKLWWLRDKLDVSLQGAAKILTTYPSLFDLSIEASLEPKLW